MMTLEEAIRHCEEKSCGNSECAAEHRQLAEWLTELKQLKTSVSEDLEMAAKEDARVNRSDDTDDSYDLNRASGFVAGAQWQKQQMMKEAVLCGSDGWFINNKRNCRKNGRFHKYYVSTITHDKPLPMENGKDYRLIVITED